MSPHPSGVCQETDGGLLAEKTVVCAVAKVVVERLAALCSGVGRTVARLVARDKEQQRNSCKGQYEVFDFRKTKTPAGTGIICVQQGMGPDLTAGNAVTYSNTTE